MARWMVWVLLVLLVFTLVGGSFHDPAGKHHGPRGPLRNMPWIAGPVSLLVPLALIGSLVLADPAGPLPSVSVSPFVPPKA